MAVPRPHRRIARPHFHVIPTPVREWGRILWEANVTGMSSMLAYNMLLGIVPLSLISLFAAGQILRSKAAEKAIESTLQSFFPGTTKHQLDTLLQQVQTSTSTTGILAIIGSLWLASSFWGSLDTAFSRIYGVSSRSWLRQKRFAFGMVIVLVLLLIATVATPIVQSLLRSSAVHLPYIVRHVHGFVYGASLALSLLLLFGCLCVVYFRVPNLKVPWHAVWPGALGATIGIGVVAAAFPIYLSSISTITKFSSIIVFIVIVLGWFWVVAIIILACGVINAVVLKHAPRG